MYSQRMSILSERLLTSLGKPFKCVDQSLVQAYLSNRSTSLPCGSMILLNILHREAVGHGRLCNLGAVCPSAEVRDQRADSSGPGL